MKNNENAPFIFYLTFEENLPRKFYTFHKLFSELDFVLVPVRIDQLQKLMSCSDQSQVMLICSVTDSREFKCYNEKIRGLLKFVLKSKRLSFFHLSSFSKINESKTHNQQKNYFFMKYPLDARDLSQKIARYYELKSEKTLKWPGGKRAGIGAIV
jgi:hypothetical protein